MLGIITGLEKRISPYYYYFFLFCVFATFGRGAWREKGERRSNDKKENGVENDYSHVDNGMTEANTTYFVLVFILSQFCEGSPSGLGTTLGMMCSGLHRRRAGQIYRAWQGQTLSVTHPVL